VPGGSRKVSFQNFDDEMDQLQYVYSKPDAALIPSLVHDEVVGVVGIRNFLHQECEEKTYFKKLRITSV